MDSSAGDSAQLSGTLADAKIVDLSIRIRISMNTLLSMPVTACAAEPNWSKWGATFMPNRNRLGLESAKKLIFVQQNDPATCKWRDMDVLVE